MINKFINIIFLSFIFSFVNKVNSQDNTFFRKYNLYGMQGGLQLSVTSDGGFIATGQHEGNGGNGDCDIYVYRVDLCGNIVWFKLYGTDSQEGGKSIKQTSDGGFIVSGLGPSNTSPRAFNMKLDPNGNIEWAKRYPSGWMFYSHEATNGDFISLAENSLFRSDAVGNVLWRKYIGFMGSMNLWLDELSNGDIIVTSTGNGSDIYVGRFTSIGDPVWIKKYGSGYSDSDHTTWSAKGVVNSIENSVCVTSPTYLGSQGGENILVMKLNLNDGSLIWSKAVGGAASDQSRDIKLFPRGYAIAGNTASYPVAINPSAGIIQNFGERDALLFTMDENGNEIWARTYGGDERDKAIGVQYNSDNGFTLSAYSTSSIFGNFDSSMDPLFIKTDSLGFVACQTNSPPLIFQDASVSITPILTQPSNEGIDSYSFTPNVLNFSPSDSYICQQCISTPLFQVSDTTVCVGDTVNFFNTTIIGLTCFQQWYIDGQQYDGTINPFYSFDAPGDYQIQLMSTCGVNADTFNIVIHVYPIPTVDAGIDTNFCVNGTLTLSAGGADTYIWSNGVINNVPFFPSSSGTYSVIGTTIYGCLNYDTSEIIINMRPEVVAQDTILCSDIACGLTLGDDIDGPTASTYNIITINSNGLSSSAGNPLVANGVINSNLIDDAWTNSTNAPVDVIYTIVPISAIGCEGTPFTVTLTIKPEPVVLNQVATVCSEELIGVTLANDPNGPNLQSWNITNISIGSSLVPNSSNVNVGTTISNQYVAGDIYVNNSILDIDVIYSLIPNAINACIGNPFTITITVFPLPVFNVFDAVVCADHYVTLTGNPSSYSYNWDHGVSNNVPFIPPYTDTYNVVATNTITGCIQYSSALVTVHPNPIADFIQSWDELMAIFTNTSSGAVNYYWNMGDGGIIITSKNVSYAYQIIDSVSYIVTLIAETEFGCLDTISRVITTPLVFYVPNSFTPDGNENNNEFTPVFSSKRKVENYSLSIYDRWGEIVFETKDIDFGWDGTYKKKAAQTGTYTWQLQFTNLFNSKKELINGHVNLLR